MNPELIVFFVLALVAVITAVGMLLNKNAVYSAMFLILNFATVAVFYLVLGAPFIAMTQVTVYAGAIMVLFVFVIMLLGAEELRQSRKFDWQQPLALLLALILVVEAVWVIFFRGAEYPAITQASPDFAGPFAIGEMFFREYFLPFQVTGVLLLAAMVGAIVITKQKTNFK
jgi:NADH-quinone oxidoreductase subunit J